MAPCGDLALRKTDSITLGKHIEMILKETFKPFRKRDRRKGNCKKKLTRYHAICIYSDCFLPEEILGKYLMMQIVKKCAEDRLGYRLTVFGAFCFHCFVSGAKDQKIFRKLKYSHASMLDHDKFYNGLNVPSPDEDESFLSSVCAKESSGWETIIVLDVKRISSADLILKHWPE